MYSMRVIGAVGFASCVYATAALGGDVAKLDPALDKLIDPDAKVEVVKGGFGFTEGPVWVQKGKSGYLLFSDIPANVIYSGHATVPPSPAMNARRLIRSPRRRGRAACPAR